MKATIYYSKKISDLMNQLYKDKYKNKFFVKWQYFNKNFNTKLSISLKNTKIISMAGYFKKKLFNNHAVYQLIGLGTHPKFSNKGYFSKNFNQILPKKKCLICFANLSASRNSLLKKYLPLNIKIENLILKKKDFKKIKKKNKLYIKKKDLLFNKDEKFYNTRYKKHPINKYFIFKKKDYGIFFKQINIKKKIYLDIIDIQINKTIEFSKILNEFVNWTEKINYDYLNFFSFKGSKFSSYLKKRLFVEKKLNNKRLMISSDLSQKELINKIIFLGDADY